MNPKNLIRTAALMTTLLATLALAEAQTPAALEAQPKAEQASRPARTSRPRVGMAITGGALFVSTYVGTATLSMATSWSCILSSCNYTPWAGYIPLVGPLLLSERLGLAVGIAGTALQSAGALLALAAFIFPERLTLRQERLTVRLLPNGLLAQF